MTSNMVKPEKFDYLHLSLSLYSTFKQIWAINFYSLWNHQKTYSFLMIPGKTELINPLKFV